jgi:hypothetical protein
MAFQAMLLIDYLARRDVGRRIFSMAGLVETEETKEDDSR